MRGTDDPDFMVTTVTEERRPWRAWREHGFPPYPPFSFGPGPWRDDPEPTLLVAPGRRYRLENSGGRHVRGCDGERIWLWLADLPPDTKVRLAGAPQPPFPSLLAPSWLLSGYELSIEGEAALCGRAGVSVVAVPRRDASWRGGRGRGRGRALGPSLFGWPTSVTSDRVTAVVDAELGILLRCERQRGARPPDVAEFTSLTVGEAADPARFTAPPGSVTADARDSGWWSFRTEPPGGPLGGVATEAAKAAVGLAAGGLGAAIRYSASIRHPFGSSQAWGRATVDDDPEGSMPRDDPPPAEAGGAGGAGEAGGAGRAGEPGAAARPVSDEILHLLYRGGAGIPEFTGTLHQWVDVAALIEAVPEAARRTGFGGVGFLADALRDAARESESGGTSHTVRRVRMGGWQRYRIDLIDRQRRGDDQAPDGGERHGRPRHELLTLACDGQQRWQVYEDRVVVGPAGPPPDELTGLLDGSWLLGCDLSGGEEVVAAGRPAYRVAATGARTRQATPFFAFIFPAVAVVDAESGRLHRLTLYKRGKPVSRNELRDVAPGGEGDFGFEVPAGTRVEGESPEPPTADAVKKRVDETIAAARGFLDSLRGPQPPPR